jgi:hypothetical protein
MADGFSEADGASIFDYYGAMSKAGGVLSDVQRRRQYTVKDAIGDYVSYLRVRKKSGHDAELKLNAYLIGFFLNKLPSDLKPSEFDQWVASALEHNPRAPAKPKSPMKRGPYKSKGELKQTAETPVVSADERNPRKRATINRIINYVKACLTRSYTIRFVA